MADLRRSVRDLFLQGVEAVNNAANHVATATRSKVDELNLRNRRKELLDTLATQVYEQWLQGLELPESMTNALTELQDIDAQLAAYAPPAEAPETVEAQEEEQAPTIEVEAEPSAETVQSEVPHIEVQENPEE